MNSPLIRKESENSENSSGKTRGTKARISGVIGRQFFGLGMAALLSAHSLDAFAFASSVPPSNSESEESRDSIAGNSHYREGYQSGGESAGRITAAVYGKTVGRAGCTGLGDLEGALIRVVRAIKAPRASSGSPSSEEDFVQGYFKGYYDKIRSEIRNARDSCDASLYDSGVIPGRLSGAFVCASSEYSTEWVLSESYSSDPIYENWSGGVSRLSEECAVTFEFELVGCALGSEVEHLGTLISAGCR